jgi:hypothetical protein
MENGAGNVKTIYKKLINMLYQSKVILKAKNICQKFKLDAKLIILLV